jgi:phospholipase A1
MRAFPSVCGAALFGVLMGTAPGAKAADTASAACARETDDARRLACYDGLFRHANESRSFAEPEAPPANAAPPAQRAAEAPMDTGPVGSVLSKAWELDPDDKRGTFIVRTYLPNYFLPLHYTSELGTPASPTHPPVPRGKPYRHIESKLQISLRAKVAEDVIWPGADVWVAYTQRSLWQLWTSEDSSPFRSTDYEPEAMLVVPIPVRFGTLPGGWRLRMAQLGVAHQSNGQSDPLSRSWNRVYASASAERGEFGLQLKLNKRLPEGGTNDNPDLTRYIGRYELTANWLPGRATAGLTWRTDLKSGKRGSLQFDWTYPVRKDQLLGLRWYVQLFSGYGETLLDYNHRQTSFGAGLTLFQF